MSNERTFTLPLNRFREPDSYPEIIAEMKEKGFVFASEDGKYPLKLQEPFNLVPPADPRGGSLHYIQWDEEPSE